MKINVNGIRNMKFVVLLIKPIYFKIVDTFTLLRMKGDIKRLRRLNPNQKYAFHLGIPTASNLGDLAQCFLIDHWIHENYPEHQIVSFASRTILDRRLDFFRWFDDKIKDSDIVFFQSGYNTHDLGGDEDIMHKEVIARYPNKKMVMMPQTVYYKTKKREQEAVESYCKNPKMLFLARDQVSYEKAKELFPSLRVELFPDIVTTLIGRYCYRDERQGVMVCRRTDTEKYYSDVELELMEKKLRQIGEVTVSDTTITVPNFLIKRNIEKYVNRLIENFSHYKVIITDRYHGTIFGLIAGTPVIVLKTSDHKVTTGLDWFRGIYDDYVYMADTPEQAVEIAKRLMEQRIEGKMRSYFKTKYYDHLLELINQNEDTKS